MQNRHVSKLIEKFEAFNCQEEKIVTAKGYIRVKYLDVNNDMICHSSVKNGESGINHSMILEFCKGKKLVDPQLLGFDFNFIDLKGNLDVNW